MSLLSALVGAHPTTPDPTHFLCTTASQSSWSSSCISSPPHSLAPFRPPLTPPTPFALPHLHPPGRAQYSHARPQRAVVRHATIVAVGTAEAHARRAVHRIRRHAKQQVAQHARVSHTVPPRHEVRRQLTPHGRASWTVQTGRRQRCFKSLSGWPGARLPSGSW